jgi:hypothetical protein
LGQVDMHCWVMLEYEVPLIVQFGWQMNSYP